MSDTFLKQKIGPLMVVEFNTASLMDPVVLQNAADSLYKMIDEEDQRQIIMDFTRVQYISSQAMGIILGMNKKLGALKNSKLILCGVGPKLMELLKLTRVDRVLTIKPTQKEAIAIFTHK